MKNAVPVHKTAHYLCFTSYEYQLSGWVIINGDGGCSFWQPVQTDSQPKSSGLVLGRRPLGAILHSSNESGELSQWLCDDDSTINIVVVIIIIIIIIIGWGTGARASKYWLGPKLLGLHLMMKVSYRIRQPINAENEEGMPPKNVISYRPWFHGTMVFSNEHGAVSMDKKLSYC